MSSDRWERGATPSSNAATWRSGQQISDGQRGSRNPRGGQRREAFDSNCDRDRRDNGGHSSSRIAAANFATVTRSDNPAHKLEKGEQQIHQNQSWNFWTMLCGPSGSPVVFTGYKGHYIENGSRAREKGWIGVPLFQTTTDEEVCERFRAKLRSIACSVAECEELRSDGCRLMAHLRIGDLFLFHKHFHFDCRLGPNLDDFNLLLEGQSFPEARQRLNGFFRPQSPKEVESKYEYVTSTFVTEKFCGSHATIEAFLNRHDFEAIPGDEFSISVTLNGDKQMFDLYYNLTDLKLQDVQIFTHKWNLNIVTAKGTNYQGTFRETADFRLQFDTSFGSKTDAKVIESLTNNGFDPDSLQQLFERHGEAPPVPTPGDSSSASVLSEGSERSYRFRLPELIPKLDYFREQHNRKFVREHERWPLVVQLRQFRFFSLAKDSTDMFTGQMGVEFRVNAELDCQLDREVLDEPEFVSHLWDACQLMQDLVATSLEA